MNDKSVVELAEKVAKCCGIRISRSDAIFKKMRGQFPVTTILHNEDYILWIDRHYIAVVSNVTDKLLYIYISKFHVSEELRELVKLREKTETTVDYDHYSVIINQLLNADKHIKNSRTSDFVLESYLPKIRGI